MSGARFVRLYPSDWRSGCVGLSLEQEGFYIRLCAYIFETGRRLSLHDSQAAKFMGLHTNAYKKVRDQLAQIGKLKRHEDGWTVERAERELAAATNPKRTPEGQADQDAGREASAHPITSTPIDTPPDTPIDTGVVFSENAIEINAPLKSLNLVANKEVKRTREKGSRLSPEWQLSSENREWARVNCFASSAAITAEADKFRDYWISKPGATKLDWDATWRNWCRRSFSDAGKAGKFSPQATASYMPIKIRTPDRNWTDADETALLERIAREQGITV